MNETAFVNYIGFIIKAWMSETAFVIFIDNSVNSEEILQHTHAMQARTTGQGALLTYIRMHMATHL